MSTYPHITKKLKAQRIGVISDTHGLLRPEALHELEGVDLIIHAGDIGARAVLDALKLVAPVVAIKGNNDRGGWAKSLSDTKRVEIKSVKIYVIHNVKELDLDPVAHGIQIVISGHSHKPSVVKRDGVLYLNPGSAGPRRFKLPIAVGILQIAGTNVEAKIVELVL